MDTEEPDPNSCCPYCNQCVDDGECEHLLACISDDGEFLAGAADALWSYFVDNQPDEDESSDEETSGSAAQVFRSACDDSADTSHRRSSDHFPVSSHVDLFWAKDTKDAVAKVAKSLRIFDI